MNKKTLEIIKRHIAIYGGITLNHNGKQATLQSGYMVSKKQYEKVLTLESLDLETLNDYLLKATKLNKASKTYKVYVGLWLDNSKLYLDISMRIEKQQVALQIAKQERQLVIYDNVNATSIFSK